MTGKIRFLMLLTAAATLTTALTGCSTGSSPVTAAPTGTQETGTAAQVENMFSDRDLEGAYEQEGAAYISLGPGGAEVLDYGDCAESSVIIADGSVTLSAEGVYVLSGEAEGMQLIVEAADTEKVQLVLAGVRITSGDGPAVYIKQADKVFVTLESGTENYLMDSTAYTLAEGEDEPNACLFSKDDLTINGAGTLTVTGNYHHGIFSKDDLTITGGSITVSALNDGIKGKDCVQIKDGSFSITSGGDGIQSSNSTDEGRGYVYIEGGSFAIDAQGDGIQAETSLEITGGNFEIITGGGSVNAPVSEDEDWGRGGWNQSAEAATETDAISMKALKGGSGAIISGGSFTIDSYDDAVHTNGAMAVLGGEFDIKSGDDAFHADGALVIDDGMISVAYCYEGLEGTSVTVNGGNIGIDSADDGINSGGGTDSGMTGGFFGQDSFSGDSEYYVEINGGVINITAGGDGLDSNGAMTINGGEIYVCGGENGGNGAIDSAGTPVINGGTVVAAGSPMMAMGFGGDSAQCSIMYTFTGTHQAGEAVTLTDAQGNVLLSYEPAISYQNTVVSCPGLEVGGSYTLTAGSENAEIILESTAYSNGGGGMQQGGQRPAGDFPQGGRGERPQMSGEMPEDFGGYGVPGEAPRDGQETA